MATFHSYVKLPDGISICQFSGHTKKYSHSTYGCKCEWHFNTYPVDMSYCRSTEYVQKYCVFIFIEQLHHIFYIYILYIYDPDLKWWIVVDWGVYTKRVIKWNSHQGIMFIPLIVYTELSSLTAYTYTYIYNTCTNTYTHISYLVVGLGHLNYFSMQLEIS